MNIRLSMRLGTISYALAAIGLLGMSGCASRSTSPYSSSAPGPVQRGSGQSLTPAQQQTISNAEAGAAALGRLKAQHPGPQ